MALIESSGEQWDSPIEVVARMATDNELPFEREVQDEIAPVCQDLKRAPRVGDITGLQQLLTALHQQRRLFVWRLYAGRVTQHA